MSVFDRPVLVVDDSQVIRALLRDILQRFGFEDIHTAANAQEALAAYQAKRPGLVFLDITMPEVPGTRVANHILKDDPTTRIVVVTAVSRDVDLVESVISMGVYDYLRKPVREEDIAQVLKRIQQEEEGPAFRVPKRKDA